MKKYELVSFGKQLGSATNLMLELEHLKAYTINRICECQYSLRERYTPFMVEDEGILSWVKGLEDKTIVVVCSEILMELDKMQIYEVFKDFKILYRWFAEIPNGNRDNDQILYQLGFQGSDVSRIEIYVYNEFLASFGSRVCGSQKVHCYKNSNGEVISSNDEEAQEYNIWKEPELLEELFKKQNKDNLQYLHFSDNCWLEGYFDGSLDEDLSLLSDELHAEREVVHNSISENINLSYAVLLEIKRAINTQLVKKIA